MGQIKGNPALDRTPERQAYTDFYGVGSAAYRSVGSQPVMIDARETLNDVVDITFETDAVAAMVSGSTNTTIFAVSGSTNTTIFAVSSSINTTIGAVSSSLSGRLTITGSCVNDAAAASAGVPVGGLYHTTGTIKVRLT
jgi:hypothetical protein